jgi:DNA mismatch endonuclease (patch repair protein)
MARIRKANTKPEVAVRKILHRLGYRFRLHYKELPGSPDVVLPKYQKVIFVHGCFWHRHNCASGMKMPVNRTYWQPKLERNRERDVRVATELSNLGWQALTIWECELENVAEVERRILEFLAMCT